MALYRFNDDALESLVFYSMPSDDGPAWDVWQTDMLLTLIMCGVTV